MRSQSMADAFGAKISVSVPDRGLYLVIGRAALPFHLVQSLGGQIIFVVPHSFSLLALMPVASFLALKNHREIALAGPVSIDSARFNRFLELLGLNKEEKEGSSEEIPTG